MRCRGAAPPKLYTSSSCLGIQCSTGTSGGTPAMSGHGDSESGCAERRDEIPVASATERDATSAAATPTGARERNCRRVVMSGMARGTGTGEQRRAEHCRIAPRLVRVGPSRKAMVESRRAREGSRRRGAVLASLGACLLLRPRRPDSRSRSMIYPSSRYTLAGALAVALALSAGAVAPLAAQRVIPGLDAAGMDPSARPGDDFYRYANGNWDRRTQIPPASPVITPSNNSSPSSTVPQRRTRRPAQSCVRSPTITPGFATHRRSPRAAPRPSGRYSTVSRLFATA